MEYEISDESLSLRTATVVNDNTQLSATANIGLTEVDEMEESKWIFTAIK